MIELDLPDDDDANALQAELNELAPAGAYVVRVTGSRVQVSVDPVHVARALDHLRNAKHASKELIEARDRVLSMLRIPPLTYHLRSWEFQPEGGCPVARRT